MENTFRHNSSCPHTSTEYKKMSDVIDPAVESYQHLSSFANTELKDCESHTKSTFPGAPLPSAQSIRVPMLTKWAFVQKSAKFLCQYSDTKGCENFSTEMEIRIGMGCPGKCWICHSWRCLREDWTWHSLPWSG